MLDFLRQLLYDLLVIAVIATVWMTAWAQSVLAEEDRAWWPAKDPALVQRTFENALRADPNPDPRHPANFGELATFRELMDCD